MSIDRRDRPRTGFPSPGKGPTSAAELSAAVRNRLIESRLTPNAISMMGLLGNLAAAVLVWQGYYFLGGLAFIVGSVMDTLDGRYARVSGKGTLFGAFLDSTLDRMGDAAIFGGLVLYYAGPGNNRWMAGLALACLILGSVVSYAKARAEGLGYTADVGIAERADRLVAVLLAAFVADLLGSTLLLGIVLGLLAVASFITVLQRMLTVRRQALSSGEVSPGEAAS